MAISGGFSTQEACIEGDYYILRQRREKCFQKIEQASYILTDCICICIVVPCNMCGSFQTVINSYGGLELNSTWFRLYLGWTNLAKKKPQPTQPNPTQPSPIWVYTCSIPPATPIYMLIQQQGINKLLPFGLSCFQKYVFLSKHVLQSFFILYTCLFTKSL